MKKGIIGLAILVIILLPGIILGNTISWTFCIDSLMQNPGENHFAYINLPVLNINRNFSIPIKTIYIETAGKLAESDFVTGEQKVVGRLPHEFSDFDNTTTGIDDIRKNSPLRMREKLNHAIYAIDEIMANGVICYAVSILPLTLDNDDNIILNGKISLAADARPMSHANIFSMARKEAASGDSVTPEDFNAATGIPLNCKLLIITSPQLAGSFKPLVDFKKIIGISTAVAMTDSIYVHYSGIDKPEQIRNYLKDFYSAGGKYVLLGGDNDIVPPRYLFYYNVNFIPSDSNDLMPSDLYYADMDGEWDKDGDGVWGEPSQDSPNLIPELKVGRLPVRKVQSVVNYCTKLIAYCSNPGNGNYEYLTKSLFFTADEMRDFPAGGQHHEISSVYPPNFMIDTFSTVETPSGDAPSPTNRDGLNSILKISEGFGIINILNHGRVDGFVVKSANYCEWPASYILTGPAISSHGSISGLTQNNMVSFYYSLACNVGGYDLDKIDGASSDVSLVEQLIAADSSGAVGMVANARWGWVYSSYLLQTSFMNHLFTDANGSPFDAMYLSWLEYPYFRDLIYGQNYFGDPTLKIYTDRPGRLDFTLQKGGNTEYLVQITDKGNRIANARVVLSKDGAIVRSGYTDDSGGWAFSYSFNNNLVYELTAIKDGYTIVREKYVPSIASDVDETDDNTPMEFQLDQNYPNPFNPSTTIDYSTPARANMAFEIFNILGQMIYRKEIMNQPPGQHIIEWNGMDQNNREVSSGIYFYRLTTGAFTQTKKMILLR